MQWEDTWTKGETFQQRLLQKKTETTKHILSVMLDTRLQKTSNIRTTYANLWKMKLSTGEDPV